MNDGKKRAGCLVLLLSTMTAQATTAVSIDPTAIARYPFLSSKLGFARATGFDKLPDSIPLLGDVGARAFCTTLNFDSPDEGSKKNFAVEEGHFTADGLKRAGSTSPWFNSLQERLTRQGVSSYFGLVGAPAPYHPANIRKPAEHPTPLDIDKTAQLMAAWATPYLQRYPNANWVVWNEPEHALRGTNSAEAAADMARIYQAYFKAIDPMAPRDRFGLAAFMKGSLKPTVGEPGKNFFQSVMDRVGGTDAAGPRVDFITMNNYHGKTDEFLSMMQTEMGRRKLDQPLIFSQFAPWQIGERADLGGTNEAGALYIESLDNLMASPSIQHVCMSFWAGIDGKSFVRWNARSNSFDRSHAYLALSLYQRLAPWRVQVTGAKGESPVQVYASADAERTAVLLVNQPRQTEEAAPDRQAAAAQAGGGKAERKADRKAERKAERKADKQVEKNAKRNKQAAMPEEDAVTGMGAAQGTTETVRLTLKGLASQRVQLVRLAADTAGLRNDTAQLDASGVLTLTLAPDEIVLVQTAPPPASATLPGTFVHAAVRVHRVGPQGQVLPEAALATAAFDPLRDGFVLQTPSAQATAHATAWLKGVSRQTGLSLNMPLGHAPREATSCLGVVLQHLRQGQVVGTQAWGEAQTVQRMLGASGMAGAQPVVRALAWQPGTAETQARVRLDLDEGAPADWDAQGREVKLHVGLGGCAGGAVQTQVRWTP